MSRPKQKLKLLPYYPEVFALNAIIEIKVETAILNENNRQNYLLIALVLGISLVIICSFIYILLMWKARSIFVPQSEINLSVTDTTNRIDEEKSNNLQNEENIRRYAKGSALSLDPGTSDSQNITSQTLFKTKNVDVEKNIVQSIESKEFDKRSLKISTNNNNTENDNLTILV